MEELPIVCPAGSPVHSDRGPSVRCAIERTVIHLPDDPRLGQSVAYCCGRAWDPVGFTDCPTWRAMKEAEWAGKAREMDKEILAGVRRREE
jgi:hypothetical protein